jgi:repressor LexA
VTPLSTRQQEVLGFIAEHLETQGYWPTLRQMREALGIKSLNGVSDHLKLLIKKGYVRHTGHGYVVIRLADGQRVVPRLVPVSDVEGLAGEGVGR